MRFTLAWAKTVAQNVTLRFVVVSLGVMTVVLAFSTAKLSLRKPIVIERGCVTRLADLAKTERSSIETESFVKEAVQQRFNSEISPSTEFLSSDEIASKIAEQKELSSRGMTQSVVVRSVKISAASVSIEADRLISVGNVRSAFVFPLAATLVTSSRNQSNPYGLRLHKISQIKMDERK